MKNIFSNLCSTVAALGVATTLLFSHGVRADEPAKAADTKAEAKSEKSVPRAAVITMGERGEKDMVGQYMTAETLKRMVPMLEEEKIDIVVLRFYSGGGALFEIQPLSDEIHNVYKKKFKTVGWIEAAISAAAMTAHCIPDIYFTSQANYGACTGWSGNLVAMKGRGLEEVLALMEKISERGNHDYRIMRAMQISSSDEELGELKIDPPSGALSANIDEKTGDVTWYQDTTSGTYVLNPKNDIKILTFTAPEALKFKFSKGTADTLDELTSLMGYKEIEWVGDKKPGSLWPICKAEKFNMTFRAKTFDDAEHFREYVRTFNMQSGAAQGENDRTLRAKFVNRAIGALNKMRDMVRNNPNMARFQMNMEPAQFKNWAEEQERQLKQMLK